jgi:hypothetical protein
MRSLWINLHLTPVAVGICQNASIPYNLDSDKRSHFLPYKILKNARKEIFLSNRNPANDVCFWWYRIELIDVEVQDPIDESCLLIEDIVKSQLITLVSCAVVQSAKRGIINWFVPNSWCCPLKQQSSWTASPSKARILTLTISQLQAHQSFLTYRFKIFSARRFDFPDPSR